MNTYQAIADLQTLPEKTHWQLHSQFKQTFNLVATDDDSGALLLIATEAVSMVPGGIFLKAVDFAELITVLDKLESVVLEKQQLTLTTAQEQFKIQLHQGASTQLDKKILMADRAKETLAYLRKEAVQTGFDLPLQNFTRPQIKDRLQQQTSQSLETTENWLDFFIGRGRGLTPAGDDFLIGWLLIEQLQKSQQTSIRLQQKITQGPQLTTAISQHYLVLAAHGYFGVDQLAIANLLAGAQEIKALPRIVEQIIRHGHTSGSDFLAGLACSLQCYLQK